MKEKSKFSSRAAVLWSHQACASYWNVDFLLDVQHYDVQETHDNELVSLSYDTVLLVTVHVVNLLREKILTIIQSSNKILPSTSTSVPGKTTEIAVPIAVAIPEGPFLPLAVLAVHALNIPFYCSTSDANSDGNNNNNNDGNFWAYSVLVPIEPGEGKDRIRHMLADTRPAIILCLECDRQRLSEIISSLEESNSIMSLSADTYLFRSQIPVLLNFAKIAQDVIMDIQADENSTQKSLSELRDVFQNIKGNNLQELLGRCMQSLIEKKSQPGEGVSSPASTNRVSHIAFTSGSTGKPKGSFSSIKSLQRYIHEKNKSHYIIEKSVVLMASAVSFDPCLSDILATFQAKSTLAITSRNELTQNLPYVLNSLHITHVLCTPTLWSTMDNPNYHTAGNSDPSSRSSGGNLGPENFPSLELVALGGEPIPKTIVQTWARRHGDTRLLNHTNDTVEEHKNAEPRSRTRCRLYATYGVTEACVYQTLGEVTLPVEENECENTFQRGQDVGKPLEGIQVRICVEQEQDTHLDVSSIGDEVGEIVLYGSQIDEWSAYLNSPDLNQQKFVREVPTISASRAVAEEECQVFYRTGDRGKIDSISGNLMILGRIEGEEGMLKWNGVRVELGEIEAALIDDAPGSQHVHLPVVVNAIVAAKRKHDESNDLALDLHAYCLLSRRCSLDLGIDDLMKEYPGVLCNSKAMWTLLQTRCKEKVRAGCTPSAFIFVPKIPLAPTGKRDRQGLPPLSKCCTQETEIQDDLLSKHGLCGIFVAEEIASCLNIQPCQQSMLVTTASFSMLGGDSLAATRIARALYARHHGVDNTRFLGGKYGTIDGPFSAVHLVRAPSLGQYVDFLDRNGICTPTEKQNENAPPGETSEGSISVHGAAADAGESRVNSDNEGSGSVENETSRNNSFLYDALMVAASRGQTSVALALLNLGANPNWGEHGGRLGKISGRNKRKSLFRSSPLHLACLKGDPLLVKGLLLKGAKVTSPDASGSYPLHLAASGDNSQQSGKPGEYKRRRDCVECLLDSGTPLLMKDGNKQTVLHCAARAGNCQLINYIMPCWKKERAERDSVSDSSIDWRDHWSRTVVHWSIINGHVNSLRLLLDHGCNPDPQMPGRNAKRSSIAVESPIELCQRIYGITGGIGLEIANILEHYRKKWQQ